MPAGSSLKPGVIPVQRMAPGDHAYVGYDHDAGWTDVLNAYVQGGLARGERVMVLADPALGDDEVVDRLCAGRTGRAEAVRRRQLVTTSMRQLIAPDRRFTVERQLSRIEEETELALNQRYSGLRTFIDMRWVADLDAGTDLMSHRETHAQRLFTGRPYSEICAYDSRCFTAEVLDAMHLAHPCDLLARPGMLRAVWEPPN